MNPQRLLVSLAAALAAVSFAASSGCGGSHSAHDASSVQTLDAAILPADAATPPPDAAAPGPDAAPVPISQAAVASALPYPDSFASTTTFRVPFTVVRTGTQVEVALWGNNGTMTVSSAYIGRYLGSGSVDSNTRLLFGGKPGVSVPAGTIVKSDPLEFAVQSGGQYAVSFAASGAVPRALDDIGFEGILVSGDRASAATLTGTLDKSFRGVKFVSVFGPPQRVVSVLGDSIAAGEAAWGMDKRFIDLAQIDLGYPVLDSARGGDGVEQAESRIDQDVLPLPGLTDCLVEIGTNDMGRVNSLGVEGGAQWIIDGLTRIYSRLNAAGLKTWGATIIPKGTLTADGEAARVKVNEFILTTPLLEGVVDFAAAVADPADPSKAAEGMLAQDGIHPLNAGHRAMADAMVKAFRGEAAHQADAGVDAGVDAGAR